MEGGIPERHWDAFRSIPRVEREAINNSEAKYVYYLQCFKLCIFVFANVSCLVGAFISKSIVYLLATNILRITPKKGIPFYDRCEESEHVQDVTHFAFACASLWIIHTAPDVCAFTQNLYKLIKSKKNNYEVLTMIVVLESCRSAGLTLLTMGVFPLLDVPRCVLLSCGIVMLSYLRRLFIYVTRALFETQNSLTKRFFWLIASVPIVIAFLGIATSAMIFAWQDSNNKFYRVLPTAMALTSFGYWECWIDRACAGGYFNVAFEVKYGIRKLNTETRVITTFCRVAFACGVLYWALRHHDVPVGTLMKAFVHWHTFKGEGKLFILAYIAVFINFCLRFGSRFMAAVKLQLLPMFHPVFLIPPVLFLFFYSTCNYVPICGINNLIQPFGLSLACEKFAHGGGPLPDYYFTPLYMILYLVWSYITIRGDEFAIGDEIIEAMPAMLTGLDINQSQIVFRHAIDSHHELTDLVEEEEETGDLRIVNGEVDRTLVLYVCATMWHETRIEMTQMIKSVLRLDEEQAVRLAERNSKDRIKFKLEAHIFLDDAWEDDPEFGRVPNDYFRLLFDILGELTGSDFDKMEPYSRILVNTSYGGRLIVRLNCGTLLFVHLKDKKLIRNKKRWSQVMYMYYLLGHRIMDSHLTVEDRQLQAENTYILAIDGDSKFVPSAVIKLLHLMNTKSDIGCACGRIHPIGQGLMVWYQKFEYAIAHWFQKAAEHVFGCVLCAPGCFSLFRASALMDDNVMQKYTKTASEPRHFVQYDQGEDRWLSTLLLKQGYRIEYAAAADAETYAPEGFEEFFNQRRRWTPSSVANTIDLLADYKLASQNNESISMAYILYQMIVIGFSMLGPAIIFSMLIYAQVAAFHMDATTVLTWNSLPVCFFITSCFVFESSFQLKVAKILSVVYAFVMLAVLIATTHQIVLETFFSPTATFVLTMVLIFVIASLIHPKEFSNIIFGGVFFLMIPATYVLLMMYSLINLNVINWGTREAVAKATGNETQKENIVERWLRGLGVGDKNSMFSQLFSCCIKPPVNLQISENETVKALERRFERTERAISSLQERSALAAGRRDENTNDALSNVEKSVRAESYAIRRIDPIDNSNLTTGIYQQRSKWMEAEYLQSCDRGKLKPAEEHFWDSLIDKYLRPIEISKVEQTEIAKGLAELRNKIAFSLIILNGLLVLAVFLLQRHRDVLSVQFTPYDGFKWTKRNETTGKFEETTEALKVDPLGMGIIFFLSGILIVQTVGMFIHRINTLAEALHEISEVEVVKMESAKFKHHNTVLESARYMLDTAYYSQAHGATGYVRRGVKEITTDKDMQRRHGIFSNMNS